VKKSSYLTRCAVLVALAVGFMLPAVLTAGENATHPELEGSDQYMACSECHKEATPDIYKQWYDSLHGIAMVKCYQCHGTLETFRVTPTRDNCSVCHEKMIGKCSKDKDCWQCHAPHTFKKK